MGSITGCVSLPEPRGMAVSGEGVAEMAVKRGLSNYGPSLKEAEGAALQKPGV